VVPNSSIVFINMAEDFTPLIETKKPFSEEVSLIVLTLGFYYELTEN
jgi:hypothetical protein